MQFRTNASPVILTFAVQNFPGFCGGAIITGLSIETTTQPNQLFQRDTKKSWHSSKVTTEEKAEYMERWFEYARVAMVEFTSYLEKTMPRSKLVKSTVGVFDLVYTEEGQCKVEKLKGYNGLTRAFIFLTDAVGGESNYPFTISNTDLARADSRWKAANAGGNVNPNTNRLVNAWILEVKNNLPHERRNNFDQSYEYLMAEGYC